MTQTVTGAVAVRDKQTQLVDWLRTQQSEIAMIAATHVKPSAIVRVAHGALRRDPKLMAAAIANPLSLLNALLDAARLGHEPDTDDYYLVPFGNEVTGIEGYKGIIERMFRAGAVSSVVAEVVYQNDVYRRTGATTPPVHEYDEFADPASRGPLRGAYAYAVMLDGRFSKVVPMGRAEIMKHKAMSKGSDRSDSPWQKWEESMWKKCPLRGLEPYVPTSTEYRSGPGILTAAGAAELSARAGMPGALRAGHPLPASVALAPAQDIVDGELVDDPADRGPAVPDGTPVSGPAAGPRQPVPTAPSSAGTSPTPATGTTPQTGDPQDRPPTSGSSARRSAASSGPSRAAQAKLEDLLRRIPLGEPADVAVFFEWVTGHPAAETLTAADVKNLTTILEDAEAAAEGDVAEAASQLWLQHKRATGGE